MNDMAKQLYKILKNFKPTQCNEIEILELSDWKRTAILFEIENPLQLFKILNNKKIEEPNKLATEQILKTNYRDDK